MASPSSTPTPLSPTKRKRGQDATLTTIPFSFDLAQSIRADDGNDGNSSPSSKVAHKFRGLELETGGDSGRGLSGEGESGLAPLPPPLHQSLGGQTQPQQQQTDSHVDLDAMRKRPRQDDVMTDAAEVVATTDSQGKTVPLPEVAAETRNDDNSEGSLHRAYPSINRLSESKSRRKKRSGSPPLRRGKPLIQDSSTWNGDGDVSSPEDEEMEIVDPVRAALTWHEHEITVYDPEDEDDDGTGINGVGFKPTPALAHARAMKRKQQMAEYRRREESDARAKRSERRKAGGGGGSGGESSGSRTGGVTFETGPEESDEPPARKVRFTETDSGKHIAISSR